MKKRVFSIFLSLCLLLALMPISVLAEEKGSENKPSAVWVNGVNIMASVNNSVVCGNGTAQYDAASNTLTLNDAVIETVYQKESAGIFADGNLNIVVNGDSSIAKDGIKIDIGICVTGALDISGEGRLTIVKDVGVKASDISLADASISVSCQSNSFYASGGTITVYGGDITAASTGNYPTLWADADMTITGGKVSVTSAGSNGIGASGSLSITGTADVTAEGPYPGLFASKGISINGGKVKATGTNDSGIFTRGILSISGTADVTAKGGLYCGLQADGAITISGGEVNAISPNDSAIYTPVSITVTGSPKITAEGYLRALQTDALDISGGTINATSVEDSAIMAKTHLAITGDAHVIANGKVCALLAENEMILSTKNIEAYSETNYAVCNVANDIKIGGKLTAESEDVYAIRSFGDIITDSNADVSATGGWGGIQADGDITFDGSKIEAVGNDDDGIYSTGVISINSGSVHAKGTAGYAAIRAKAVQTSGEAAESKIVLSNLVEKNGGKVAFIDWFVSANESKSFTTFIGKDDTVLKTNMSNALSEVWLAAPRPDVPVIPSPPSEDVINDPSDKTTTADTKPVVTDGKAEVLVDQTLADKIIDKAAANESQEIVIDAATSKDGITGAEVQLPSKIMEEIVNKTDADMTIKTDAGGITFDQKAAETIASNATGENITISIYQVKAENSQIHLELQVADGEKIITDFGGGKITVTVELSKDLKDKDVACVYIDKAGKYHKMDGKKNDDGTFTFTTGHFLTFAIMIAEEAEKVIAEQTAARIKAGVKATTVKVSSVAGKGWIRIKWKRSKGFKVDYYQVFRSTKKNIGYGTKAFYTTKTGTQTTYKNTKAVKKGTRYYYKVRGVRVLDGKKVYTKWSGKVNRIAK